MASSTTMPNTIMKPNRLMILALTSKVGISIRPPAKEIGMPRTTQKASERRRNIPRSIKTKILPCKRFQKRVEIRPRKLTESSSHVCSVTPSGKFSCALLTYSCTVSEIVRALSSPSRFTSAITQRSLLKRVIFLLSSKLSLTVATSPKVTAAPLVREIMIFSKSDRSNAWFVVRKRTRAASVRIDPAERSREFCRIAVEISLSVRP